MLTFPDIDPVALAIGPLTIHWYGLTYLVAFAGVWWLANYRAAKYPNLSGVWSKEQISDLVFYSMLGAILGGRIGSVLFYSFDQFLDNPLWLFQVWNGGMSFHGGLIGVLVAFYWYSRKLKKDYFEVLDFIAPFAPFGIASVRLGNFVGGELWGRPTEVPWGMVFPHVDQQARHPSQLYEFALEGVVLFIILWWLTSKPRPRYLASGVFGVGYGCARFFVEFYRQPDFNKGFIAFDWLTMGQLLSTPMILAGIGLIFLALKQSPK